VLQAMNRPQRQSAPRSSRFGKAKWLVVPALLIGANILWVRTSSVEEPKFTVVARDGALEIRDYPATVAAEVTVTGDQHDAAAKGFRLLAAYIFGGNTRRQSIAMTAPVAQERVGEQIAMTAPVTQTPANGAWLVRFTMPAGASLASLPRPNDPRVTLRPVAPARYAVIRFSGFVSPTSVAQNTATLMGFVSARGLHPVGVPTLAQYNPPWTLWFLRRNEVMIRLAA
jgi:hypothetical protein